MLVCTYRRPREEKACGLEFGGLTLKHVGVCVGYFSRAQEEKLSREKKENGKKMWSINSRKSKDSRGQFNGTDTSASLVLHG